MNPTAGEDHETIRSLVLAFIKAFLGIALVPTVLLDLLVVLYRIPYLSDYALSLFPKWGEPVVEPSALRASSCILMVVAIIPQGVLLLGALTVLPSLKSGRYAAQRQKVLVRATWCGAISIGLVLIGTTLDSWAAYRDHSFSKMARDELSGFFFPLISSFLITGSCLLFAYLKPGPSA